MGQRNPRQAFQRFLQKLTCDCRDFKCWCRKIRCSIPLRQNIFRISAGKTNECPITRGECVAEVHIVTVREVEEPSCYVTHDKVVLRHERDCREVGFWLRLADITFQVINQCGDVLANIVRQPRPMPDEVDGSVQNVAMSVVCENSCQVCSASIDVPRRRSHALLSLPSSIPRGRTGSR